MQKSADEIFRAAGVEKRKVGSCEECRASKHRCTKTRPACRRCILRNLNCTYPGKQDREPSASGSLSPGKQAHSSTSPKQEPRDSYTPMDVKPLRPDPDHRHFQPLNRQLAPQEESGQMTYPQGQYQLPQLRHQQEPQNASSQVYNQSSMHNSMGSYAQQAVASGQDTYNQMQPTLSNIPQYQSPPPPQQIQHQMQPPTNNKPKRHLPDILANHYDGVYSERLPDDHGLRKTLVLSYFGRSAPLRNLSFLHKPSFLKSLDQDSVIQDYGEPLLYVMCALGAR